MASFVYFLPNQNGAATNQVLIEVGLAHAIYGAGPQSAQCNNGPGGTAGLIVVADHPRKADCMYWPDRQTWRKSPDGKFWVGHMNDARPGPEDLARDMIYMGQRLTFQDGREWIVPRCHGVVPQRPATLPSRLDLSEDGKWIGTPAEPYAKLADKAFELWQVLIGVAKNTLSAAGEIDLAAEALAVNYRIGRLEIAMLGLWTTDDHKRVLRAMIDADEIEAWGKSMLEKKTGQNISRGT